MDVEALKLISQGGIAAALLGLIYLVGMKLVAAIDRIGLKLDEHTKTDVEHHGEVKEAVVGLHGKIDGLLDGQERQARYTPAFGAPTRDNGKP